MIDLKYCSVEFVDGGIITRFPDGAESIAWPYPDDPHYVVISHRCGYRDDVMAYCREHDFVHSFLAEKLFDTPSGVVWASAHGTAFPDNTVQEEALVQMFQRWLRANEELILAGADWDGLREEALRLLRSA